MQKHVLSTNSLCVRNQHILSPTDSPSNLVMPIFCPDQPLCVCCFNVGSIADKILESIKAKHIGITVAQERPGGLPPERERDGLTAARENVLLYFGEDVAIEVLSL